MRRLAKGSTTHPALERPGMGFGRPLRPRPGVVTRDDLIADVVDYLRERAVSDALGERVAERSGDRSSVTRTDSLG